MYFNALSQNQLRELSNMVEVYSAWKELDALKKHSYSGSMFWRARGGREYLYQRTRRGSERSLGARTPESEAKYKAWLAGRDETIERLKKMSATLDEQAGILRALATGRIPLDTAAILRNLNQVPKFDFKIVGTHALYLYEMLAGVRFGADQTATRDIDILLDDRKSLKVLTDAGKPEAFLLATVQAADASFKKRTAQDFRLTNAEGYMVEFLRAEPRPPQRRMPLDEALSVDDVQPARIAGLQWLVSAPSVSGMVLDMRGYPLDVTCPDPRFLAAHKAWVSARPDRDPLKSRKDYLQAKAIFQLVADHLPQLRLDDRFLAQLPGPLRQHAQDLLPDLSAGDGLKPRW